MSRHEDRAALGRRFGATDVIAERGEEGVAGVRALLGDIGADAVLECVGTKASMEQAIDSARPGGRVGYVGVPTAAPSCRSAALLPQRGRRRRRRSGARLSRGAPRRRARRHDRPRARLRPAPALAEIPDAYAAMDERRSIKPLLVP
jgi:threonine dehydrogenase-like Zn-dependent dehydrogenase